MAILSSLFLFDAIAVTVCLKNNRRVQFRQNYCDSSRKSLADAMANLQCLPAGQFIPHRHHKAMAVILTGKKGNGTSFASIKTKQVRTTLHGGG
ncbi:MULTISPECIES: hypothetical protein [Agrobacterium]|jgi:hypothetical protein|nr:MULTISPECIES: hypothetical protein [Agrobacterium]MCZ7934565.1 hypothetical protein [Agrobacterium leguminum]